MKIPNGWRPIAIGDLANHVMGFAFKSGDFLDAGVPLIRMGNLYQNKVDLARNPARLPAAHLVTHKRFKVRGGDLLMSMTGTMGKRDYGFTVQYPDEMPDALLNQRVI